MIHPPNQDESQNQFVGNHSDSGFRRPALGDGAVTIADFNAVGTQVKDTSTPAGGSGGDVISFVFDDISDVTAALVSDLLTVRLETDNFASIQVASLENASFDPTRLEINYTPVPLPASLPLFAGGIALLAGLRARSTRG